MQPDRVNLDNYSGFWCVEPVRFTQMVDRVNSMNLLAHIAAQEPRQINAKAKVFESPAEGDAIAVIDIRGTMTKAGSSLSGGGTIEARHAIRQADRDPSIGSIILRFDTPGGTVAGTADLANEIGRTSKPTIAFIEDLCCSAGMWAASQCDEIYANDRTAMVGSIGTFMAVYDISGALAEEKIRTIVIKAGEFKGGGFPGTEITDSQIAEWQKIIDATQAEFTAGIAKGRKLSQSDAEKLVTGLAYMAGDAVQMKLIDGIKTFDEVVEQLRSKQKPAAPKGRAMSKEAEPKAATYKEILAACPGINAKDAQDALFIAECQKNDLTAQEANENYCATLQDRLKASQEENGKLKAEVAELKTAGAGKPKGAQTVGTQASGKSSDRTASNDAVEEFKSAVAEKKASGMPHGKAVLAVHREKPHLREAMLAAAN